MGMYLFFHFESKMMAYEIYSVYFEFAKIENKSYTKKCNMIDLIIVGIVDMKGKMVSNFTNIMFFLIGSQKRVGRETSQS